MKKNIGDIERVIRFAVGLSVVSLFFVGPRTAWALLGLIPMLTALIGWCPPYTLLGINTCNKKVNGGRC